MFNKDRVIEIALFLVFAAAAVAGWRRTIQGGAGNIIPAVALSCSLTAVIFFWLLAKAMWSEGVELMLWPRGVRTLDDRSQIAWLHDPQRMASSFEMDASVNRTLEDWSKAHPPPLMRFVLAFSVPIVFSALLYFARHWFWPGAPWYWPPLIGFAVMPLVLRRAQCEHRRWRAPFFVSIGRCPSCGYELSQLPIEADGCVVCPECGGAWRRSSPPGGAGG
jgi:ssDNA-binding Zn-finger/Zn-ribbon topoisomerase 1